MPAAAERRVATSRTSCDASILRARPHDTSVEELRSLTRPRAEARRKSAGSRVYVLEGDLVGMRAAGAAIDLILAQPGNSAHTISARLGATACRQSKRTAQLRAAVRRARAALIASCGRPAGTAVAGLEGTATITSATSFRGGARKVVELGPVLRFHTGHCGRPAAPVAVSAPLPAGPAGAGGPLPFEMPPQTEPPPEPQPEPNPPCTDTLSTGAIEAEANRRPGRVICLETAYYSEPGDAVIAIYQDDVRIQAAPDAHPIVCGRFILRGSGSTVARDVTVDASCATYFNEASPFNLAGGRYPSVPVPQSWLADFDGTGVGPLALSRSWEHGKPVFRASAADPVTATFRIADASQCFDDPIGCEHWQPADPAHRVADETSPAPEAISIPAGVACPGLPLVDDEHDRSLTIVSADGKTAWDLWHCTHAATPAEPWYTAGVATRWAVDPDDPDSKGYQSGGSNSSRASGMPLVSTTITPREAVEGIHHALGLTVKSVSDGYVGPPASHSDGCSGCSHLSYGMLFALDPGFRLPDDATIGEVNVVQAMQRYGVYVVDKGPLFELDGSPNEPSDPAASDSLWDTAGVGLTRLGIKPSDLRYVPMPGSPDPAP
jgi:hypothetical protein